MKRTLGNSIFLILLLLSVGLVAAMPFLSFGFTVLALGDEPLANQPGYILLLLFLRPYLCVAFFWSVFALAVRRKWLLFGTKKGLVG